MTASSVITSPHVVEQPAVLMQVAGLNKHYGEQRALIDVSFDVGPREVSG